MKIRLTAIAIASSFLMAIPSVMPSFAKGVDPEEKVEYLLTDHLGGVDVVMDEQGNVVERRDYLPFGEERVAEVSGTDKERHGFTGKELDSESGLYYYGARYYDPALGRFASLDPLILGESAKSLQSVLGNPQALNGYSYVLNNPVRYVDETGMYGEDVHYDLTFFMSSFAGFSREQAQTIAFYDQNVDENPATLPQNLDGSVEGALQTNENLTNGATMYYHFAGRQETMERLGNAMVNNSLEEFGTALHSFQDSFSHAYINPAIHAFMVHTPDMTEMNTPKALDMAKSSFYFLRGMNAIKNGFGDLSNDDYNKASDTLWEKIEPQINKYLSTSNKSNTDIAKSAQPAKGGSEIKSNKK